MRKKTSFSDQMRKRIGMTARTCYRISKELGIDAATLSRFMIGLCGLSHDKLDTLASCLGWSIVVEPQPAPKARKAGK